MEKPPDRVFAAATPWGNPSIVVFFINRVTNPLLTAEPQRAQGRCTFLLWRFEDPGKKFNSLLSLRLSRRAARLARALRRGGSRYRSRAVNMSSNF